MRAIFPPKTPLGREPQANPGASTLLTSSIVPITGAGGVGPFPGSAKKGSVPPIVTPDAKARSFQVAPTVIADGAVPGEVIVPGSGPLLPADFTTITPAWSARSTA